MTPPFVFISYVLLCSIIVETLRLLWSVINEVRVRKRQSMATSPRAIAARERKRKLDWHCVYVFVRMVQGYAIALLGTNVTHPVFMKYHPIGTHIQTYSPPRLQQQDTSLRAWSIVLELVCVCHAASLDIAAVSPPFSSPPG